MKNHLIAFFTLFLPFGATAQIEPTPPPPIAYDYIREADVFWQKRIWRVIDTRMKQNLPFAYPKEPLAGILISAVQEGALQPYDPFYGDEFSEVLSRKAIQDMLYRVDSIWTISPFPPYNDTLIVTESKLDPLTVTKFRVKEDWIFDEERSEMVVRIIGIAPVRDVMDPTTGEKRGESIMFWINYPEARQFLSQHFAFNTGNDFIRHTWEGIFEMRFFDSYIVKEDNVHDREISSYASGIDAVLESERIKQELMSFEHELWTY